MRSPSRVSLAALALAAAATSACAQGFICAEGGGNPNNGSWADDVFGWMVDAAEASRGSSDVLIIGVGFPDTDLEQVFRRAGADSADSLRIRARNADNPALAAQLEAADIVWIRGGDQADYVEGWDGTATEAAIRAVYDNGGVVGGTSAGCAVLGEIIYDARNGSLFPDEALRDARHPDLTLTTGFLSLADNLLFDTHFTERGRIGRLAVILAAAHADIRPGLIGVGVDDRTALCVSPDGTAEVRGEGSVTLMTIPHGPAAQAELALDPGDPPLVTPIAVTSLLAGHAVDLATLEIIARPAHADTGPFLEPEDTTARAFTPISLSGSSSADGRRGDVWADDRGDPFALFDGALDLRPGSGNLAGAAVATRAWESTDFDENRVGGALLALQERRASLALVLDLGARVDAAPPARLAVDPAFPSQPSALVLDARGAAATAASLAVSGSASEGPRQSVSIEAATLHVLPPGATYDAVYAQAITTTQPCSPADVARPFAQTDAADARAYLARLAAADPATEADLFPGLTIFDALIFLAALDRGCP